MSEVRIVVVYLFALTCFFFGLKVGGKGKNIVEVADPPAVIWAKELVKSSKQLNPASTYENPCSGTMQTDTIIPTHPGGYFVAGTRTTNHTTNDAGHYGENL